MEQPPKPHHPKEITVRLYISPEEESVRIYNHCHRTCTYRAGSNRSKGQKYKSSHPLQPASKNRQAKLVPPMSLTGVVVDESLFKVLVARDNLLHVSHTE